MKPSPSLLILLMLALLAGGGGCSRLNRKARLLAAGERYYQAGNYDQAEIAFLNVLKKDPRNAQAVGRLALIYVDQGRFERASPFLLGSRELSPDNLEVRAKLASGYFAMGNIQESREEAKYILDKRPDAEEALYLFTDTARTDKEVAETRQRLENLLQNSKETAPLRVALGSMALRRGDLPAAEESFQRALKLDPKSAAANWGMFLECMARKDLPGAESSLRASAELSPLRSQKRLQYVQFKIQSGDPGEGRRLLESLTQAAPDYLPALASLAELDLNEKKQDACADLIGRLNARDPGNKSALFLSGRLKLERGDFTGAIHELEQVTSQRTDFAPGHYCLGLAYLSANENRKGEASLTRAVWLNPNDAAAALVLAEFQIRKGDYSTAILSLNKLVQIQPQLVRPHLLLANAYLGQKKYEEALRIIDGLKQSAPKSAEPYLMSGTIYVQQKKEDEARRAFEKALELLPHDPRVVELLVNLDLMDKQYPAASQRVEKELDPKLAATQILLAKIYGAQQDFKSAEAALKKALEIQPEAQGPYMLLARLYLASQQGKSALDTLESAVKKDPKDTGALLVLGMTHEQQKDFDAARDAYQKVLAVNPNSGIALNNLAVLYAGHYGRVDEALVMARKLRELNPKDPLAADTLGWIFFKKGQYGPALSFLREGANNLPANAEVQFHAGAAEYRMGNEEEARTDLLKALERDKEVDGHEKAARWLAVLAVDVQNSGAEARKFLEEQVAGQPDDPVASSRLAALLARGGAYDRAASLCERILKTNPENVGALCQWAELQADHLNQVQKGMELAKTAYKLAPDDAKVSHLLGRLAYRTGNFKWALSLLQESAQRQPDSAEALYDLAEAFYGEGRVPEAVAVMKGALAAKPPCARADAARRFLDLVDLSMDPSPSDKAEAQAAQEFKTNPASVPALMLTAALAEKKGAAARAEPLYEKALAQFPDFTPAKQRLALLYSKDSANNPKAFDVASQAHEAFPDDLELTRAFGIIAYRRGDYGRSADLLQQTTGNGSDAEAMYYLGMCQSRLKKTSESRKSLQRALELNLSGEFAAEAKKTIAGLK